jgi:hypothetical protein
VFSGSVHPLLVRPHNDGAGVSVPNAVASASFDSDCAQSILLCRKLACQLQREPGQLIYLAQARGERKRLGSLGYPPSWKERIRNVLTTPGRPGVRKIAQRFGVDPGTVQRISRPFEASAARA